MLIQYKVGVAFNFRLCKICNDTILWINHERNACVQWNDKKDIYEVANKCGKCSKGNEINYIT